MIINLKSQSDLSGLYLIYEGSTNLEKDGNYGISHAMEHLMCKNFEHLRDDFEREGIDWNAYTSDNEIVFYFTGLDKYINKRKYEIVDLMSQFNVSKEQFENERKIVLQEYGDNFSDQVESHSLNLGRKLFRRYDPIGRREDLENLRFMDCLNFFEEQYANPSKLINVSGKHKFEADIDFVDRQIDSKLEFGPFEDVILEPMNDFGEKRSLIMYSPIIESDFNYVHFLNSMLSMGLSSPLYKEVREKKGLVYYIRCGQHRVNKQGLTGITTQTSAKNVDAVFETVGKVLKNPTKHLTQERFDTVKNSYLIRMQKEKINRYANVNSWINPTGWSVKEIIKTVTLDKILEVFNKYYDFNKFYLSDDKSEFVKS